MRHEPRKSPSGFLVWFLGALAAVFVVEAVLTRWFGVDALWRFGALSPRAVLGGEIWTPFTYALLHGSLSHLLLNGIALFFIGRVLENVMGARRLAWLTAAAALGGALAWLGLNVGLNRPGSVIGASAVAMAYLTVFACLFPWRKMTVLLFFIIPVSVQPFWLVTILGGIDLLGLITHELPGRGTIYGVAPIAHSAHLGGMIAGWLFHRFVLSPSRPRSGGAVIEPPKWFRKRAKLPPTSYTVNIGTPASATSGSSPVEARAAANDADSLRALRAEVDRILDKISQHGVGSLTEKETRVLDEARQLLSHR